jgi:hypothetical protein
MRVGEYLGLDRPAWDWVTLDCCRWIDGWVVARGHASPMAAIGVEYDSERSALRRIAEGGGLAALWTAGMTAIGIEPAPETDDLLTGDVGVIQRATSCGTDEAAAIWTGERWVTLGLRGLDFGPAEPLAVWHV